MCWLVIDGYEDEPAAFGVPNYVGFHIRYICGVLEKEESSTTTLPSIQWRTSRRRDLNQNSEIISDLDFSKLDGVVILAGAVVPGKYVRGTPVSRNEIDIIMSEISPDTPILCGGWAIRQWRYSGWSPLRLNLFCTVQDVDATLNYFLEKGAWKNMKRTPEQWSSWALEGAKSKAVSHHPDLFFQDGSPGPLTYEVELYKGLCQI